MRKSILHAVWMFCLTFTAFAQSGLVYETRTVKSDILKMERKYAIYLPPGYAGSDQFYRDEQGRIYQFITNNREISNEEVALIYRLRRTIKLVFKK
jgi:hypothetical protein